MSSMLVAMDDPNSTMQSVPVTFAEPGITLPKSVTSLVPLAQSVGCRIVTDGTVAATTVEDDAALAPFVAAATNAPASTASTIESATPRPRARA
jgi:hypothetical protein